VSARGWVGRIRGRARTPATSTTTSLPAPTGEPAAPAAAAASFAGGHERLATEADRAAVESRVAVGGPPRDVLIRTVPLSLKTFLA